MSENYQKIEFQDEMLADRTVCRRYSDGRIEWRTKLADFSVEWRDNRNLNGVDEMLGDGIIKRTWNAGQPVYGREQGYGRTLWSDNHLTVNKTSFPGVVGAALAGVGGALLLGSLIAPPSMLATQQEEELRRQRAAQQQQQSSSSGGDSDSSSGGDWDEGGDMGDADGDFG